MNKIIPRSVSTFFRGDANSPVRIPPEPRSRSKFNFSSLLSSAVSVAARSFTGGAFGGSVGGGGGIDPQYMDLINKQIEMQEQMQLVSMTSNIEKSQHESKMAAIRNVRAG